MEVVNTCETSVNFYDSTRLQLHSYSPPWGPEISSTLLWFPWYLPVPPAIHCTYILAYSPFQKKALRSLLRTASFVFSKTSLIQNRCIIDPVLNRTTQTIRGIQSMPRAGFEATTTGNNPHFFIAALIYHRFHYMDGLSSWNSVLE
jgi:hypothetical protein